MLPSYWELIRNEGRFWLDGYLQLQLIEVSTPPKGYVNLYAKNNLIYIKDSFGNETALFSSDALIAGPDGAVIFISPAKSLMYSDNFKYDSTNKILNLTPLAANGTTFRALANLAIGQGVRMIDGSVDGATSHCDIRALKEDANNATAIIFSNWNGAGYFERFRIAGATGDHLIGVSSGPATSLQGRGLIVGRANESEVQLFNYSGSHSVAFRGLPAGGNAGFGALDACPIDRGVALALNPRDETGFPSTATAVVFLRAAENQTTLAKGSYATIETTPIGSATRAERLRVLPDGGLRINSASTTPATPPAGFLTIYAEDAAGVARLRAKHASGSDLAFFRDAVTRVRNESGVTIPVHSAVYFTGANGSFPTVALAKADDVATMPAMGITLGEITNNSFGTVQFQGLIRNMDTSAFAQGDILYVSATNAGVLVNTPPAGHQDVIQQLAIVISSGLGNGQIQVFNFPLVNPAFLDHGALADLSTDDHAQYLLASDAGGRANFLADWTDLTDGGETALHSHAGAGVAQGQLLKIASLRG